MNAKKKNVINSFELDCDYFLQSGVKDQSKIIPNSSLFYS